MNNSLFRKKSLEQILKNADAESHANGGMSKILGVRDLVSMGIAAVIGAGIFSTIGAAAYDGGPGVIFLFVITAITCGFTALCYAEFASRVPVSGSAYTYSYVTFGEVVAWIIGWSLILEYAIGNIVVAISWSSYFDNILQGVGIILPRWMVTDTTTALKLYEAAQAAGKPLESLAWTAAPMVGDTRLIFNLPAFVIVILVTILAYIGIKESKKSANAMVGLKLMVLLLVVVVGVFFINTDNWTPFFPNEFGGVLKGVSAVFFAYIGFDAISTTAEECANPQRDLPRGMIYSLLICTIIYIVIALVITGMVNYSEFQGVADPLAYVFDKIGQPKVGYFVSVSAVVAATSVLLVFQIGQPRIWMSMSRDGLLPKAFSRIHPKYSTPSFATIMTGFLVAIPALFMDASLVTDLTSIGTLFAFVLVCGGVLVLPRESPTGKKSFSLPYINGQFIIPALWLAFAFFTRERIIGAFSHFGNEQHQEYLFLIFTLLSFAFSVFGFLRKWSLIPVLGVLCCSYLMIEIPVNSWFVFFGWMAAGLLIYFGYGYRKSKIA
ncbi:amino acid permease [Runella slithyformis]|uniref:Amino acid permease-associated region n=1 Tax=Runella slithyformis (strain ATCC 29530 / DSM 19594 / LMG 11500 / NCIMB 11436 / LSU 4) TaxID=761193 RepID=A0A7U3ZIQ1_RUNSL|nr:amino acid permease [Runella slithyformis]AEI47933.1 amino acid permease-associated region [Runella slithyformis DSM 19594]